MEERKTYTLMQEYAWRSQIMDHELSKLSMGTEDNTMWKELILRTDRLEQEMLFQTGKEEPWDVRKALNRELPEKPHFRSAKAACAKYLTFLRLIDIAAWVYGDTAPRTMKKPKGEFTRDSLLKGARYLNSIKELLQSYRVKKDSSSSGVQVQDNIVKKHIQALGDIMGKQRRLKVIANFNMGAIYLLFMLSGQEKFSEWLGSQIGGDQDLNSIVERLEGAEKGEFKKFESQENGTKKEEQQGTATENRKNERQEIHWRRGIQLPLHISVLSLFIPYKLSARSSGKSSETYSEWDAIEDSITLGFHQVPVIEEVEKIVWRVFFDFAVGKVTIDGAFEKISNELPFEAIKGLSDIDDSVFRICPLIEIKPTSSKGETSDVHEKFGNESGHAFSHATKTFGYGDVGEGSCELLDDRLQIIHKNSKQLRLEGGNVKEGNSLAAGQCDDDAVQLTVVCHGELPISPVKLADVGGGDVKGGQHEMCARSEIEQSGQGQDQHNALLVPEISLDLTPAEKKFLPTHGLSIADLLRLDYKMSSVKSRNNFTFSEQEPDTDLEKVAAMIFRPNSLMHSELESGIDSAIKKGSKSITVIDPSGENSSSPIQWQLPFKAISMWGHIIDAQAARSSWSSAMVWLGKKQKSLGEATVNDILAVLEGTSWEGVVVRGENTEALTNMATVLSKTTLPTTTIDIMISNLAKKFGVDELRSHKCPHGPLVLAGTELGQALLNLSEEGQPQLGLTVLSRLPTILMSSRDASIHCVVDIGPNHYVAVCLRLPSPETLQISWSDPIIGSQYPASLPDKVSLWATKHFPGVKVEFNNAASTLPRQRHTFSAGIIAINAIHRQLDCNATVWSKNDCCKLRASAFLDIMKPGEQRSTIADSHVDEGGQTTAGETDLPHSPRIEQEEDDETMEGLEQGDDKKENDEMTDEPKEGDDKGETEVDEDQTLSDAGAGGQTRGSEDELPGNDQMIDGSEEDDHNKEAEGTTHLTTPLGNYRMILRSHTHQRSQKSHEREEDRAYQEKENESDGDDMDTMEADEDPARPRKRFREESSDEDEPYAAGDEEEVDEEDHGHHSSPPGRPQRKKPKTDLSTGWRPQPEHPSSSSSVARWGEMTEWVGSRAVTPFWLSYYTIAKLVGMSQAPELIVGGLVPEKCTTAPNLEFFSANGQKKAFSSIHFPDTNDYRLWQEILEGAQKLYVNGVPPHVGQDDLNPSVFHIMDYSTYQRTSEADLHNINAKRHIVITGYPTAKVQWSATSFTKVARLNVCQPRNISDMTVQRDSTGNRICKGSIMDILQCGRLGEKCKGLASLPYSCPDTCYDVGSPLATDQTATNFIAFDPETVDSTIVDSRQRSTKFCTISTAGAVVGIHKESDGASTLVDLCFGAQAWAVIRGPQGQEYSLSNFSDADQYTGFLSNRGDFKQMGSKQSESQWTWEVLLVEEGTRVMFRAGTDQAVLTLQNSITFGGYYYSISAMRETFLALVQTIANQRLLSNSSDPRHRLSIRRVVQYMHETLVQGTETDPAKFQYMDGENMTMTTATALFACISLGVLCNVLDVRTYSFDDPQTSYDSLSEEDQRRFDVYDANSMPEMERVGCIYTRGAAFELLHWFTHKYELRSRSDASAENMDTMDIVLNAVAHESVGVYVAALCTESPCLTAPNVNPDLIESQLRGLGTKDGVEYRDKLHHFIGSKLQTCKQQDTYNLLYDWEDFTLHECQDCDAWNKWETGDVFNEGRSTQDRVYLYGLDTKWGMFPAGTDSSGLTRKIKSYDWNFTTA